MGYIPTEWDTEADKQKFADHFKKFVESEYKRGLFYKWFYTRLSMCFGFIAHYDIHGFYATYFTSHKGRREFERKVMDYPCWGSPSCTYSDVESDLGEWMKEHKNETISK